MPFLGTPEKGVFVIDFWVWGGYSWSAGQEQFPSLAVACRKYVERYESNSTRKVDGFFWPTWGDCQDDDYVITDANGDGWTRREVFEIAEGLS